MERAEKVLQFIRLLKHSKAPFTGQPFEPTEWQIDFIRKLYGTVDDNNQRQYKQGFLFIPRKNGKTTLAAALALYHLIADGKKGGEVYLAAGSRDQAHVCYNQVKAFINMSKPLRQRLKITEYKNIVEDSSTGSFLKVLSSDGNLAHGLNPTAVICDELHTWNNSRGRELWSALQTGSGTREEPMLLAISTAGTDQAGPCWDLYTYSKKVKSGRIRDDNFLPVIFEADPKDKWWHVKTWKKANPGLDDYRNRGDLEGMVKRAKHLPSERATFERLYLNRWTREESYWLDMDKWDGLQLKDQPDMSGRAAFAGLDLSATTDLTSFVMVIPDESDPPVYHVISRFWIPETKAAGTGRVDAVDYRSLAQENLVTICKGEVVNYRMVRDEIIDLSQQYNIQEIAIDRWNATSLGTELGEAGLNLVGFGQGYATMSPAMKELETLILSKRISHNGDKLLRWNMSNVVTASDPAGNIKPDKSKSKDRIDGAVALIMAAGRAAVHEEEQKSVYESREVLDFTWA